MPQLRIREAAAYLGVSDDTVRRWVRNGRLVAVTDPAGRQVVDGYEVALLARDHASAPALPDGLHRAARNRFVGLVTDIQEGAVMTRIEVQSGPFRVVSLMTTDALLDLGLELGSVAVAAVDSASVVIEAPSAVGPGRARRSVARG